MSLSTTAATRVNPPALPVTDTVHPAEKGDEAAPTSGRIAPTGRAGTSTSPRRPNTFLTQAAHGVASLIGPATLRAVVGGAAAGLVDATPGSGGASVGVATAGDGEAGPGTVPPKVVIAGTLGLAAAFLAVGGAGDLASRQWNTYRARTSDPERAIESHPLASLAPTDPAV